MLEKTDEELMKAYQQGDDQAFAQLYRRHSSKVYGYIRKSVADQAFADDVFQASFLKLHSARAHYDPSFPFLPWLFTVCKSVMIDSIRKRQSIQEDLNELAVEQAVAAAPELESVALPELGSLPDSQRKAIELRYAHGLSFEEIAKKLDTSPMNVRQLVSRAIKKIKSLSESGGCP
jgi:RNA polymerase sigma-70 factor, ECF subfamily